MHYLSAEFGDDMSSGVCVRVHSAHTPTHTHTHTRTHTHTYTHIRTEPLNALRTPATTSA